MTMLISADDLEAIVAGRVDTAFRRWVRPTVKAGGTLMTADGVLAIEAVDVLALNAVTAEDLSRAGFNSRDELDAMLGNREGTLYRIRLRYLGEDPRAALREQSVLAEEEAGELAATLARMDGGGPWVHRTLELIAECPGHSAQELAEVLGLDKTKFKNNVRRLKSLGLTESLAVGYQLSPRGRAWLDRPTASA
jgi:biotin operon repressor